MPNAAAANSCNQALLVGMLASLPVLIWIFMHKCLGGMKGDSPLKALLNKKFTTITLLVATQVTTLVGGIYWAGWLHNGVCLELSGVLFLTLLVLYLFGTQDAGQNQNFFRDPSARRWMTGLLTVSTFA